MLDMGPSKGRGGSGVKGSTLCSDSGQCCLKFRFPLLDLR